METSDKKKSTQGFGVPAKVRFEYKMREDREALTPKQQKTYNQVFYAEYYGEYDLRVNKELHRRAMKAAKAVK